LFPVPFLLVAFAVLFLRLEEPNAWLLALLFCAFIGAPGLLNPSAISPPLRAFAFAFRAVFSGMLCPLFYLFFAVFPLHSPLDRRFAWLKGAALLFGTVAGVLPIVLERVAVDFTGYHPPFWLDTVLVLVVFLYPLSFAYAVVKHRVMELPVLLRRSARYVLVQRGFIVFMFMVAA